MDAKNALVKRIEEGFERCAIPEHMREGIKLYIFEGVNPGNFMTNVLANDLVRSCVTADRDNLNAIVQYAEFLYNYMPMMAWGSLEKVHEWKGVNHENE